VSKPRVILGGSRSWTNERLVRSTMTRLRKLLGPYIVVYGAHWEGADLMIERVAKELDLDLEPHPADWQKHQRSRGKNPAGQIRNREMAEAGAVAYVGFWDGTSTGTSGMASYACRARIPVTLVPDVRDDFQVAINTVHTAILRTPD
jgi:hypothetical protein